MEKSRAIELLKLAVPIKALTQQEYSDFIEAINMAIDALELPTIHVETDTNVGDTISRQAAIDECNKRGAEHIGYAIAHLPAVQPEQLACEYCHEDSDGYVKPLEKNCHASIRFGMDGWELSLYAKGWHGSAKIKYCPICGRRLTHE